MSIPSKNVQKKTDCLTYVHKVGHHIGILNFTNTKIKYCTGYQQNKKKKREKNIGLPKITPTYFHFRFDPDLLASTKVVKFT